MRAKLHWALTYLSNIFDPSPRSFMKRFVCYLGASSVVYFYGYSSTALLILEELIVIDLLITATIFLYKQHYRTSPKV